MSAVTGKLTSSARRVAVLRADQLLLISSTTMRQHTGSGADRRFFPYASALLPRGWSFARDGWAGDAYDRQQCVQAGEVIGVGREQR